MIQDNLTGLAVELSPFPIPYPKPSTLDVLPQKALKNCVTLGDVSRKLEIALEKCGYYRSSYFHVPNGFALVTQLENINEDGTSKRNDERWALVKEKRKIFSISEYIRLLFTSTPGHYRSIVFLVSDEAFHSSGDEISKDSLELWLDTGSIKLSNELFIKRINSQYEITALIYQFTKPENSESAEFVAQSKLQGRTHLERSKIYKFINRSR